MAESVELATILLTDLVGSTRLASSVGPVRADELREEHFTLLRDAISGSGGREVKNTGDGLMVAFSSASAAVGCAVSMQQRFERRYRRAEQGLHIRIGVGAGESTVKDGDYFGMPTIEAARLCDLAPSDGILVSSWVKHLAGRCEEVEFSSVGEVELKGFPDRVEAFAVQWAPLAEESGGAGRWPLPALLRSVPTVAYVGRVEERAALEEAMVLARASERQVVLLAGEPGIGKTRLASFGAHGCHGDGFAVCWGGCSEDLAVPYEPWIEVCRQIVQCAPVEVLERHVERHGGELARLVRGLGEQVPEVPAPQSSDPETERYLLFGAVVGLLAEMAESVPVCVVLDDLHWADAQSLAMLKHLLRASTGAALLVIATYRDSEIGKDHPLTDLLADLRRLEGVQRLALRGLGAGEVAEIMAAVAGHELEADGVELAGRITADADGNPFFVGEMLRGLSESGALVFDEERQRWSIDASMQLVLPESVREVIERRAERLGEDALRVLRLGAVIGRSFDVELLAAAAEIDEAGLLDHLEAAVDASLLAESSERVGRFQFVHALVNQTLYEGLGATRRARMHQRVAQALEEQLGGEPGARVGELAHHWAKATTAVDLEKAVSYARMAGERALDELAPDEALEWFARALGLLADSDEPALRCDLLIGLGEAQRLTGAAEYRKTLLKASRIASELQDGERAARAALANNRGQPSVYGQVDRERVAAIERALQLDDDPGRRARLLALQAIELVCDPDHRHRRALAEQALTLARELGEPRTTARVLHDWFFVLWAPDTLELRRAHLDELTAAAQATGDPGLEFWAADREKTVMVEAGDLERARDAARRVGEIAARLGEPMIRWVAAFGTGGTMAQLRGDLTEAERSAKQALHIARDAGEPDAFMVYASQIGPVRQIQNRIGDIDALEQIVQANPLIRSWHAALAQTLCLLDRRDEAAAMVIEAAADRFEHVPWDWNRTLTLALYAEAAVQAGVVDAAAILYELIEPWADQIVTNGGSTYGHARTHLGLLAAAIGRDELADQHFKLACEFQEREGMLLWAARAHLGWAEALAARGETERSCEQAARALELSREHGYALFEPRAAALLATQRAAGA